VDAASQGRLVGPVTAGGRIADQIYSYAGTKEQIDAAVLDFDGTSVWVFAIKCKMLNRDQLRQWFRA